MYKIPAYACLAVLFVLAFVSWAQGAVNPVDLSERPEFKSVGTNEEARERGVSFWVVVSKSGIRLKKRAVDSLAALDAEMESAVHEAKLTPEEASRAAKRAALAAKGLSAPSRRTTSRTAARRAAQEIVRAK